MLLPFGIFIYCTTIDFYKDANGHYYRLWQLIFKTGQP